MTFKKTGIATMAAISLMVGLPASALDITVTGSTSANVGIGGDASTQIQTDASANVQSNTTSSSSETGVVVITRAVLESGDIQIQALAPAFIETEAQLESYIASEMNGDANMTAAMSSANEVSISYTQPAQLLGFIDTAIEVTATVDENGTVELSYPWYGFLFATDSDKLEVAVQDRVDAYLTATNAASTDAAFSTREQAGIIATVRNALEAEIEASAEGEASANL